MLFLVAGNTLAYFHTKSTLEARGLLRVLPITGVLWIVGVLAITGSPPFGTFLSEFAVLKGMIDANRLLVAAFYLLALATVFVGMLATVISIVYGEPPRSEPRSAAAVDDPRASSPLQGSPSRAQPLWSVGPPLLLGLAVLVLGLYVPPELSEFLHRAAVAVGAE
jgi:hydrogenase-4 component F